ncbi:Rid family hydrolase [Aneurinibacillus aneurinilyticus]|jgi:2-iminobutanoate/2-iminopropanoate deaminase|uniref:RidA family protein n=2 Tax=Aneurinibacillus aneurinilyticus TaxID=1391 RepID=A0A848CXA0_ANEAE|nr:Rid family hydrolase [Aneurinibacillus aneurinilyticus]ERI04950.1 putative endoribonuclease L-PSP [Aneurinibacillus aneurinilyticus ATCC 12856]MED0708352.1 Rid family hydrolase [Aneurinibacillus aneurinilyticus]MED0726551.1 Rid family hydrolase [Aneurinibacillus aneurinilyticus]MED0734114.1 Rid family hydrolase [Aneurinibacillus aneurinilyticus]MED0743568.1 Rid family hydrolase [Aneurinibacillus aneurinilyticus]
MHDSASSNKKAPAAVGPYSQAVTANGFAYLSGMLPLDIENGSIIGTTDAEQTEQITRNGAYFSTHKPARSCVEVAAIPKGTLVEIEVIAKLV